MDALYIEGHIQSEEVIPLIKSSSSEDMGMGRAPDQAAGWSLLRQGGFEK